MEFKDKIAVVTGATSGIGEAVVKQLVEKGAVVVALGRNNQKGAELEGITGGGFCRYLSCDMLSGKEIRQVCDTIKKQYDHVDILVNSAGIATEGTVETLGEEEWDDIFSVNVKAIYLMCKYLLPHMRKNGASIVNIGSTAGTVGAWGLHAYAATKGAVIQLSKSMAADYAKDNIRVNCVCPGGTLTPMMTGLEQKEIGEFTKLFPIGRLARPEEIARAVLFLAGEGASFMVGSIVLVDGGFTAV